MHYNSITKHKYFFVTIVYFIGMFKFENRTYYYFLEDAFNYFNYLKTKMNASNYYVLNLIKAN